MIRKPLISLVFFILLLYGCINVQVGPSEWPESWKNTSTQPADEKSIEELIRGRL